MCVDHNTLAIDQIYPAANFIPLAIILYLQRILGGNHMHVSDMLRVISCDQLAKPNFNTIRPI